MTRKCCVTNCEGNYDANNKVKTFRLPRKPEERQRWISLIPRDNIPDKKRHGCIIKLSTIARKYLVINHRYLHV